MRGHGRFVYLLIRYTTMINDEMNMDMTAGMDDDEEGNDADMPSDGGEDDDEE